MASYFSPNPNYYAFTGDGMSAPVVNAPLTAISSWYQQPGPGYPATSSTANYWVDVVFSNGGSHVFSLTSISDTNGCSTTENTGNTINVSVAKCGEFQAFLQGTYDSINNNMHTGLTGNIPLSQPYNVAPWYYNGIESVSAMDGSVVDWVLVELRTDTETSFERKAALLLEDGSIVQYNNITQGVHFENTVDGNSYYVVVYHRNHMPVMSTNALVLDNISCTI